MALSTDDVTKILDMTGRRHSIQEESRMRAILQENCRIDEKGMISFVELKKLAYLMDNPLIKLGWKPVKHEPTTGSGEVPNKLSEFLA